MATFKFRKVDEITVNAPDLEQAEAELGRQGLVGFTQVKEAKPVEVGYELNIDYGKGKSESKSTIVTVVPVTVELICDSMTTKEMRALLIANKVRFASNSREKTLAKKILDAGLFKA